MSSVNNNSNTSAPVSEINPYQAASYAETGGQPEKSQRQVGMWLFIAGFFCIVPWWVGAFYPKPANKQARTWRILNIVFGLIPILIVLCYSFYIIDILVKQQSSTDTNSDTNE
ncbi:hypothetical protein MP228_001779 [Amoeboaphelidium protococcarum]|nr:hypothetical protein MP228_001779 [Amoeboaphelidium protococcarum]